MTARQRRWITTLWLGSAACSPAGMPWRSRKIGAALVILLLCPVSSHAASLRPFRELASSIVRLSDLFDALGDTPDRDLGPSPAPGARITVEAPQLAAIARDFNVSWRPSSGAERAVLERGGTPMPQNAAMPALRRALEAEGAPAQSDIDMPGFAAPILPAGSTPNIDVSQVQYDAGSGRFSALLSVITPDSPAIQQRLSGQVVAVVEAAVLAHNGRPGAVLHAEDVLVARIHAGLLRGNVPLELNSVIGMALRHDLPQGQPLTIADIARPLLVTRNSVVRMRLEAGGLQLSAQGLAMEDGGKGDRVRVQNPSSHAVVVAEVTGDGEVRVDPARAPALAAAQ